MRFLCRICWYLSRKEKHFLGSERLPVFLEQMPQTEAVTSVTRSRSLSSLRRTGPSRGRRPLPPEPLGAARPHLLHAVGGAALALVLHDAADQLVVLLQQLRQTPPSPPASAPSPAPPLRGVARAAAGPGGAGAA